MKLVSYEKEEQDQLALLAGELLYDVDLLHPDLPVSMAMFLNYWDEIFEFTAGLNKKLVEGKISTKQGFDFNSVVILEPVPHPTSFRNAFAFRQYIALPGHGEPTTILENHYPYPAFHFGNHNCFQGPGEVLCMPDHLTKLDFEMEIAIVICKAGKNIKAAEADEYIGGYMIMNNIVSRHLQMAGTSGNLSRSGNGIATPVGPTLVTRDELEPFKVEPKAGHTGNAYNLPMKCFVNNVLITEGNVADMDYTFAEIIEQASYGVQLFPGDIIGSGPAGCFLEINTIGKLNDAGYNEQWLKEGDSIEIEIESLGKLGNIIVKDESDLSLLARDLPE